MALFLAKPGQDSMRKRKKKISFRSVSIRTELEHSQKKKKINKKHHLDFISIKTLSGQVEKEKKKKIQICSYPTRARAFAKKIKKKKKGHSRFISMQTMPKQTEKETKKILFLPNQG